MEEANKEEAKNLVNRAKTAANDGNLLESMQLFRKAYQLFPSEKIKKRMGKLQEFINSQEEESEVEDDDMVNIGKKFFLHKSIANNLYQYQQDGVLWFWKLYKRKTGGILGDDMGLGKTIQVIAFLAGMFDAELIQSVIIVAPLAVLVNWEKEFKAWAPGVKLKSYHGTRKKERESNLKKIQKYSGVLLTTYGMVLSNADLLGADYQGKQFTWDYIILDEGHKIRNPNKTSANIRKIPANFHYIVTGTAIQNNLLEMWSLFDFTHEGQLLGKRKTFEIEFQKPIVKAREKDANSYSQQVGNVISERLREIIAPYFLRRTKANIFGNKSKGVASNKGEEKGTHSTPKEEKVQTISCTPRLEAVKHDLIIWVYLNPLQLKLYQGIVKSERVKETLMSTRSPLAELNIMKKICDHPRLQGTLSKFLTSAEAAEARLDCNLDEEDRGDSEEPVIEELAHAPPVESLIEDSGKMVFLVSIMKHLKIGGHRTLIFSQSRKMLDIIQKVLMSFEYKLLRIDGTISNPQDREKIINKFKTDDSYDVLLMTTQIGSVGLNLTTADRLIIFDPSWNPGTDAQAVDRIYRLGQTKNVVIYRLITCGTIEEKIYRKQIFKNAIMKQTTGSSDNPYRYFTNQQLRELFILNDPRNSVTQIQLQEMHAPKSDDPSFHKHLEFLDKEESLFGVSHHDQLFSEEATNDELVGCEGEVDKQVQLATQRITEERNDEVISPKKKNKAISSEEKKSKKSPAMDLPTNSFLLEPDQSCHSPSIQVVKESGESEESEESEENGEIEASMDVSTQVDEEEISASFYEEEKNATPSPDEESFNEHSNDLRNEINIPVDVQEESDLVARLNATLATIKIDDSQEKSSVESASILDQSDDEPSLHVVSPERNYTSLKSISDSLKDNRSIVINSSNEDLYVSCMEDVEERIEMAKFHPTLARVRNSTGPSLWRSRQSATEDTSIGIIVDTDNESCSAERNGMDVSNVVDTDLDESCDSRRSNYSSNDPMGTSDVIFDSFENAPDISRLSSQIRVTPNFVHDLGKGYRTPPPFSPLLANNVREESMKKKSNNNIDASTPVNKNTTSIKKAGFNLQLSGGLDMDIGEVDIGRKLSVEGTSAVHIDPDTKDGDVEHLPRDQVVNEIIEEDKIVVSKSLNSSLYIDDSQTRENEVFVCNDDVKDLYVDEKNNRTNEACNLGDLKCDPTIKNSEDKKIAVDSRSFIEVVDMGCSPITNQKIKHDQKDFPIKKTLSCERIDEKISFIDVQDMGCSPIPIPTNVELKNSIDIEVSSEDLTDTVPINPSPPNVGSYSDSSLPDTVPIDPDEGETKNHKKSSHYTESDDSHSSDTEDSHFDIRRLESREKPVPIRPTPPNEHPIESIIDTDSEISKMFGCCKQQSKPGPTVNKRNVDEKPSTNTEADNLPIENHGQDLNLNEERISTTADDSGTDSNYRREDLQKLISMISTHLNDEDIDDHVLMEIGELIKRSNLA